MSGHSVLRVNCVEEQAHYRNAVADILLCIQRESGHTHIQIAETIDVSLGTISNAANKKCDLNATYLKRLGERYGAHCLNPYFALMGARAVPLDGGNVLDILPQLMRCGTSIADARHPNSQAGCTETHTEKLGYLPQLESLQADLAALIVSIRKLAA